MSRSHKPSEPVELSIGTLSSATGVPVDTLRTWERRYGFPAPTTRTGGSHRRYAADTIAQVRLIVRALEHGHRPSAVVGRNPDELQRLIGAPASIGAAREPGFDAGMESTAWQRWLELSRDMDDDGLSRAFHRGLAAMPALDFLEKLMGPYLRALGEQWARGLLRVSHEHFASEKAREFLSARWRSANEGQQQSRPAAVLATPPGERHALGLHMAAWVVALGGLHVVFLGADTPVEEIVFAVQRHSACAVALSVAGGYGGDLPATVSHLRSRLPERVSVAMGGDGSIETVHRVLRMNRFEQLLDWASGLAGGLRSR